MTTLLRSIRKGFTEEVIYVHMNWEVKVKVSPDRQEREEDPGKED